MNSPHMNIPEYYTHKHFQTTFWRLGWVNLMSLWRRSQTGWHPDQKVGTVQTNSYWKLKKGGSIQGALVVRTPNIGEKKQYKLQTALIIKHYDVQMVEIVCATPQIIQPGSWLKIYIIEGKIMQGREKISHACQAGTRTLDEPISSQMLSTLRPRRVVSIFNFNQFV